ncbi:phage integrase [Lasius niger]|uniref:Phage integrase n=1 Tax=Lasius niger TaxID=67767 RepID=A0A0J7NAJ6_LASNI|nr:phage integrase [Lasius niger]
MKASKKEKRYKRLSAAEVNGFLPDGYHGDGDFLYLRVSCEGASKTWSFRYKSPVTGKKRDYSLGTLHNLPLKEARDEAINLKKMLLDGLDPADERKKEKTQKNQRLGVTFKDASLALIKMRKAQWKDKRGEKVWLSSLNQYVFPHIGSLPVEAIGQDEILKVLRPIWENITETASRIRNRIEIILDYATAENWRSGDNPARWKRALQYRLPDPAPILARKQSHHYALPAETIPKAIKKLLQINGISALMVRFLILTGGRSMEIRGAIWEEINLPKKLWVIPKERMKKPKEHSVPLCDEAIKILKEVHPLNSGKGLIFPNSKGKPFSDVALSKTIKKASDEPKATIHGLRSTLWDWAAENKVAGFHACKASLAHNSREAQDAAYFRSDLLNERRALIEAWERFCLGERE